MNRLQRVALRLTTLSDAKFGSQMHAVGVDLPQNDAAQPQAVTTLIERGLRDDVPALQAKQEFLD